MHLRCLRNIHHSRRRRLRRRRCLPPAASAAITAISIAATVTSATAIATSIAAALATAPFAAALAAAAISATAVSITHKRPFLTQTPLILYAQEYAALEGRVAAFEEAELQMGDVAQVSGEFRTVIGHLNSGFAEMSQGFATMKSGMGQGDAERQAQKLDHAFLQQSHFDERLLTLDISSPELRSKRLKAEEITRSELDAVRRGCGPLTPFMSPCVNGAAGPRGPHFSRVPSLGPQPPTSLRPPARAMTHRAVASAQKGYQHTLAAAAPPRALAHAHPPTNLRTATAAPDAPAPVALHSTALSVGTTPAAPPAALAPAAIPTTALSMWTTPAAPPTALAPAALPVAALSSWTITAAPAAFAPQPPALTSIPAAPAAFASPPPAPTSITVAPGRDWEARAADLLRQMQEREYEHQLEKAELEKRIQVLEVLTDGKHTVGAFPLPPGADSLTSVRHLMRVWAVLVAPRERQGDNWRRRSTLPGGKSQATAIGHLVREIYFPIVRAVMRELGDDGPKVDLSAAIDRVESQRVESQKNLQGGWIRFIGTLPKLTPTDKKACLECDALLSICSTNTTTPTNAARAAAPVVTTTVATVAAVAAPVATTHSSPGGDPSKKRMRVA